jgi:hypothetical protein
MDFGKRRFATFGGCAALGRPDRKGRAARRMPLRRELSEAVRPPRTCRRSIVLPGSTAPTLSD